MELRRFTAFLALFFFVGPAGVARALDYPLAGIPDCAGTAPNAELGAQASELSETASLVYVHDDSCLAQLGQHSERILDCVHRAYEDFRSGVLGAQDTDRSVLHCTDDAPPELRAQAAGLATRFFTENLQRDIAQLARKKSMHEPLDPWEKALAKQLQGIQHTPAGTVEIQEGGQLKRISREEYLARIKDSLEQLQTATRDYLQATRQYDSYLNTVARFLNTTDDPSAKADDADHRIRTILSDLQNRYGLNPSYFRDYLVQIRDMYQQGSADYDQSAQKIDQLDKATQGILMAAAVIASGGYGIGLAAASGWSIAGVTAHSAMTLGTIGVLSSPVIAVGGALGVAAYQSAKGSGFWCNLGEQMVGKAASSIGRVSGPLSAALGMIIPFGGPITAKVMALSPKIIQYMPWAQVAAVLGTSVYLNAPQGYRGYQEATRQAEELDANGDTKAAQAARTEGWSDFGTAVYGTAATALGLGIWGRIFSNSPSSASEANLPPAEPEPAVQAPVLAEPPPKVKVNLPSQASSDPDGTERSATRQNRDIEPKKTGGTPWQQPKQPKKSLIAEELERKNREPVRNAQTEPGLPSNPNRVIRDVNEDKIQRFIETKSIQKNIEAKLREWEGEVKMNGLLAARGRPGWGDHALHGSRSMQRSVYLSDSWRLIYQLVDTPQGKVIQILEITKHDYR